MAREALPARQFTGREGSRWINQRPTPDDFATWFQTVKLHEGMEHEDYIDGITLISATEKVDIAREGDNGRMILAREEQIVFTPYPKVETRVRYFHDLLLKNEWTGVKEPVPLDQQPPGNVVPGSLGLPPGFFYTGVQTSGGIAVYIACSMRVMIFGSAEDAAFVEAGDPSKGRVGIPLIEGIGTKVCAALRYENRADDNAFMKAETGALGRALGMAGMLVIPGAGVATAEDLQEALAAEAQETSAAVRAQEAETATPGATPPSPEVTAGDLAVRARELVLELQSQYPDAWAELQEWIASRGFTNLSDVKGAALRGFVRKLEKTLDTAKQEGADVPIAEPEAPAEAPAEAPGDEPG